MGGIERVMHAAWDGHHELTSAIPFGVALTLLAFFAVFRSPYAVWCGTGLLVSAVLNVVLKHSICQPRPSSAARPGYGMPSHHSQFMAFAAAVVYVALPSASHLPAATLRRRLVLVVLILAVLVVAHGRVAHGYHSWAQVVAGMMVGAGAGLIWASLYRCGGRAVVDAALVAPLRNLGAWEFCSALDGTLVLDPTVAAIKFSSD